MIVYDLAKQLKDAGFPQHRSGYYRNKHNILHENPDALDPSVPTVEELKEALRELNSDEFVRLLEVSFSASELDEQLANIWLILKKLNGNLPRALSNK